MNENVAANTATEHLAGLVRLARQMNPDELRRFFVDCVLDLSGENLRFFEKNFLTFRSELAHRWGILVEQIR